MTSASQSNSARSESFARQEREALAGLLLSQGPSAPTLCEGWQTRDMAVHLYLREHRPDAAAGMFLPPVKSHLESVTSTLEKRPYEELVEGFRLGPPKWNPMRLADSFVNLSENFIHHEDVRRGGGERVAPRELPAEMRAELWRVVQQASRVMVRADGVQVVFEAVDDNPDSSAASPERHICGAKQGDEVRISGPVGELLLWVFGREDAAEVEISEDKPGAQKRISRRSI